MHETAEDLEWLQRLLDDSYAVAGAHLRSVVTPQRRLDAAGVVAELGAMRVMALATTPAVGEPRVGPVDGLTEFLVGVYGRTAWDDWMSALPWARIEPVRMIAFRNPAA